MFNSIANSILYLFLSPAYRYMELDAMEIELKSRAGTPEEKRMARLVQPLITDTHRLSVTLTMFTCIFNEALPLFLDRLVPPYISILLSVLFVLTMGEVKHQTSANKYMIWLCLQS